MLDLASVKAWLKKTDEARDDVLQALIDRALESVQTALDWYFGPSRSAQEILDGNGRDRIWLRQPPIDGAARLFYRACIGEAWTEIDSDLFELDGRTLVVAGTFESARRNYRVTYNEGFTTVPEDIEQLVLDMVKRKWTESGVGPVQSETLGRYSYTLADVTGSKGWTDVMAHWRRGRA